MNKDKYEFRTYFLTKIIEIENKYNIKAIIDVETRTVDFIGDQNSCMNAIEELGSLFSEFMV